MTTVAGCYAIPNAVSLTCYLEDTAREALGFFQALQRVSESTDRLLEHGARLFIGSNSRGETVLPLEIDGGIFGGARLWDASPLRLGNLDTENSRETWPVYPGAGFFLLSGVLACFLASDSPGLSWTSTVHALGFYETFLRRATPEFTSRKLSHSKRWREFLIRRTGNWQGKTARSRK